MFDSSTHWSEHARNVASVLCNGILAARAHQREQRRAAQAETEVPPHWRVRPPPEAAPTATSATPPSEEPRRPVQVERREPLPIEPLTLPPPVAPWDMLRPSSRPCSRCAGDSRSPAPAPSSTTTPASQPTPPPRPEDAPRSTAKPDSPPQASSVDSALPLDGQLQLNLDAKAGGEQDIARMAEVIGGAVNALGEVVGDSVSDSVKAALQHLEERHAEDQEHLVQRLEAALERQTTRLCEALERQAEHFAAAMARQTENLRTTIGEVLGADAHGSSAEPNGSRRAAELAGLQEALRAGFADVRAAFESNHRELMDTVRTELRRSVEAAPTRFTPPSLPIRSMVASPSCSRETSAAPDAVPTRAPPLLGSGTSPQSPRIHVLPDHHPAAGRPSPERAALGWTPPSTSHAPCTAQEAGP